MSAAALSGAAVEVSGPIRNYEMNPTLPSKIEDKFICVAPIIYTTENMKSNLL